MDPKEKIRNLKNNTNIKKIMIFFAITMIFFGMLINRECATDT